MSDSISHARLGELFEELADLPRAERGVALERVCAGDGELRRRLEAMLAAEDEEDFLSGRAADSVQLGALADLDKPLPVPERIGRYRVRRLLGEGGMGLVYLADQDHPRRSVAVKVLRGGLASGEAQRRFAVEAEVLGRLRHQGVAQVFEAGAAELGGQTVPYLAMEYVEDALPLTRAVEALRLDREARLELFVQLCEAVHHGHQKGVIHRDLKPANILVDRDGRPKIIDFGVARCLDGDAEWAAQRTRTGQLLGTLQYMSPEQCGDDPDAVDTRSDVYTLGLILHELLSGRLPYDVLGLPLREALDVVRNAPLRGGTTQGLPADLVTILLMALEKQPEARYPSAHALARDVRAFLDGEPISARPPSLVHQWRGFVRRNRVWVAAASLVVLVSLGAAAVSLTFWWQSEQDVVRLQRGHDGEQVRLGHQALLRGDLALARRELELVGEDNRGWEWHHLMDRLATAQPDLPDLSDVVDARLAADGSTLRVGSHDGTTLEVAVFALPEATLQSRLTHAVGPSFVALDPSGRLALLREGDALHCTELASGEVRWKTTIQPGGLSVSWSEDGSLIALAYRKDTRALLLDGRTGRLVGAPLEFQDGLLLGAVASPGGRYVALQFHRGVAIVAADGSGRVVRRLGASMGYFHDAVVPASFSPDESRLAVSNGRFVGVFAVEGQDTDDVLLSEGEAVCLAWTRDGEKLVLASGRGHGALVPARGGAQARWTGLQPPTAWLVIDEQERTVWSISLHGRLQRWSLDVQRGVSIANTDAAAWDLGPDGRHVLEAGWGIVRLLDVETGAGVWTRWVRNTEFYTAVIHADGERGTVAGQNGELITLSLEDGRILAQQPSLREPIGQQVHHAATDSWVVADYNGGVTAISSEGEHTWHLEQGHVDVLALHAPSGRLAHDRRDAAGGVLLAVRDVGDGRLRWERALDQPLSDLNWSPDGRVLGVVQISGAVLMCDGSDGRLLDELPSLDTERNGLAFSPDGQRIVVSGGHGLDVWDRQLARHIVRLWPERGVLGPRYLPDGGLLTRISGRLQRFEREPPGPEVLAVRARMSAARQLFNRLLAEHKSSSGVRAALQEPEDLDPQLQADTFELSLALEDNPNWLNSWAWGEVLVLDRPPEAARRALLAAEAAVAMRPDALGYHNTLGLAQLLAGRPEAALETFAHIATSLERGWPERGPYSKGPLALDPAGACLAHLDLGDVESAVAALERAEELLEQHPDPADSVSLRYLRRARERVAAAIAEP